MTIEREMMFEGICEENFDRLIEEGNGDKFLVGRVSDCKDVFSQFQCPGVLQSEPSYCGLLVSNSIKPGNTSAPGTSSMTTLTFQNFTLLSALPVTIPCLSGLI